MTDRELLERAAKAAALDVVWWDAEKRFLRRMPDSGGMIGWNPIRSSCDALLLAGALNFRIEMNFKGGEKYARVYIDNPDWSGHSANDQYIWLSDSELADPAAAFCRAVTEAAATM